jgi:acyl-CoA synthetase (NDP forming)
MMARAPKTARLHGVLVQRMARPGLEIIAGIARDADFGPQLMVGLGGIHVEVLDDVALTPVPVSHAQAERLLDRLRGAKLLGPLRGAAARDRAALADLLVRLSVLAAELPARIVEIDLNPVFVHEAGGGLTIVDALIVQRQEET